VSANFAHQQASEFAAGVPIKDADLVFGRALVGERPRGSNRVEVVFNCDVTSKRVAPVTNGGKYFFGTDTGVELAHHLGIAQSFMAMLAGEIYIVENPLRAFRVLAQKYAAEEFRARFFRRRPFRTL